MNKHIQVLFILVLAAGSIVLSSCKEKMPAEWLAAAEKSSDAICACAKAANPSECGKKAEKDAPPPKLPDGWAVEHAREDVDKMRQLQKLAYACRAAVGR